MRSILVLAVALLAGCAAEKLAQSPPAGVDLSGEWKLNVADSDDPQRLADALASGAGPSAGTGSTGGAGQGSGRRSRGGQSQGAGTVSAVGTAAALPVTAVSEVLRWPGADLKIKQSGGVAAFDSDGEHRVYKPADPGTARKKLANGLQVCGWSGAALMIQVEPDDDRPQFEERYQLAAGGQRLVQLVTITSGRMAGFAMSRVWDRAP
jgi:hypothetical protein